MLVLTLLGLFILTETALCANQVGITDAVLVPLSSSPLQSSAPAQQYTDNDDDLSSGSWQPISNEDLAGGVVRVSDDGPKIEIPADPRVDAAWGSLITAEMITSHPNYHHLPPLSECGYPAFMDEYDKDLADIDESETLTWTKVFDDEDEGEAYAIRRKRIVGGKVVPPQRHPWMVQLYLFDISSSHHSFHCAGSLISNYTVLTASHCLTRLSPGTTLDVVVVGNTDRRKVVFCKTTDPREDCSRNLMKEIEDMEVHYAYNEGNLNHDIALIYLRHPIIPNANVRPICLPYTSHLFDYWSNLKLTGVGWGSTSQFANKGAFLSDLLKQVEFDLQPRSLCNRFHMRIYGKVNEDRLCTGGNTGRASCNGDSGGAVVKTLVVPDIEEGNVERVFQLGIVSAGGHPVDTCGFQGRPAIDTNVFYFMDWILNHIVPGAASYRYVRDGDRTSTWVEDETGGLPDPKVTNTFIRGGKREPTYVNEFSTGMNIDVSSHPNIGLLPPIQECGNLPNDTVYATRTIPIPPSDFPNSYDPVVDTDMDPLEAGLKSVKREKRIVGGVPLNLENYFPWMAQIYVRDVKTDEIYFRCSGSLISKRHILTGAHCVTEIDVPFVFDSIVVGQYNRNSNAECINEECFSPVIVKIADVVVHWGYEKYTHKNNLALVRLDEDLVFTKMIHPICLPRREALLEGIKLHRYFAVGWGRILREETVPMDVMSEILLKMYVDILPRMDCDFVYSRSIDLLDRSRFCGGGQASQGECLGDGGGPLMKKLTMDASHPLHNKVFQVGIISFADCGMEGMPTVYMNVIYYMKWILDHLVSTGPN